MKKQKEFRSKVRTQVKTQVKRVQEAKKQVTLKQIQKATKVIAKLLKERLYNTESLENNLELEEAMQEESN